MVVLLQGRLVRESFCYRGVLLLGRFVTGAFGQRVVLLQGRFVTGAFCCIGRFVIGFFYLNSIMCVSIFKLKELSFLTFWFKTHKVTPVVLRYMPSVFCEILKKISRSTHGFKKKKFCQFGPAVWPAMVNIKTYIYKKSDELN